MEQIRAGKVASVILQGDRVAGRLQVIDTAAVEETRASLRLVTTLLPVDDTELILLFAQHEVDVHARYEQMTW